MAENEFIRVDRSARWRKLRDLIDEGAPASALSDEIVRCLVEASIPRAREFPILEMVDAIGVGDHEKIAELRSQFKGEQIFASSLEQAVRACGNHPEKDIPTVWSALLIDQCLDSFAGYVVDGQARFDFGELHEIKGVCRKRLVGERAIRTALAGLLIQTPETVHRPPKIRQKSTTEDLVGRSIYEPGLLRARRAGTPNEPLSR